MRLPLAFVTGIALGVVIWLHTRDVLARAESGAVELLPTVLAAAVLLELAPVGAGLIVAARTGASLGAELASMKVGEQIDALQLLGVSPLRRLIGPRVLACVLAVPVLHILIAAHRHLERLRRRSSPQAVRPFFSTRQRSCASCTSPM